MDEAKAHGQGQGQGGCDGSTTHLNHSNHLNQRDMSPQCRKQKERPAQLAALLGRKPRLGLLVALGPDRPR